MKLSVVNNGYVAEKSVRGNSKVPHIHTQLCNPLKKHVGHCFSFCTTVLALQKQQIFSC
jgi:hypothetical protein